MERMLRRLAILGFGLCALEAGAQAPAPEILSRIAEEAEVLRQNAPKALSQETLEQEASMPPSRFRPRIGASAAEPPKNRTVTRRVVSEYTVGTLKGSDSGNLVEFRQVMAVDGRRIQSAESARRALSMGVQSADDRARKRMLEDFAKHGLVDIATDYAMILLAFTKRGLAQMKMEAAGEDQIGSDGALVYRWEQISAESGELEFHGRHVTRHSLKGTIWVRKPDGLPLRIRTWVEYKDANTKHVIRDEGTVDYAVSSHGFLEPSSVLHRHMVDQNVITENRYRYEPFKLFGAQSEIKFTVEPEAGREARPVRK